MSWTLCASAAAVAKAGLNANSTIAASSAALARWSDEAESSACAVARSDVVTKWTSLTAKGKEIFQKYCTADIAQNIVNYDMSGFTSRNEAIMMLNVLENQKDDAAKIIKEDRNKTYLGIT